MASSIPLIILITVICFFVSLIAVGVGIGGGIVYTPILILLGGDMPRQVIPTSLFLIFITALSGTIGYIKEKKIDFKIGSIVSSFALIGAPIGAYISQVVPKQWLTATLSLFIILVSIRLFWAKKEKSTEDNLVETTHKKIPVTISASIGLVSSILSASVGIGGGLLITPMLVLFKYSAHVAAATGVFCALIISAVGFAVHLKNANLSIPILLVFGASVFLGAQLGSRLLSRTLSEKRIKQILGFLLVVMAIALLFQK